MLLERQKQLLNFQPTNSPAISGFKSNKNELKLYTDFLAGKDANEHEDKKLQKAAIWGECKFMKTVLCLGMLLWVMHGKTIDEALVSREELIRNYTKNRLEMLFWAHYRFRQRLITKTEGLEAHVIIQNDVYESKICSQFGKIQRIGGSEVHNCRNCGIVIDRDENGARGISAGHCFVGPWS
ncbi:hypothetical protein G9A89_011202 [Geosiphon pyriformis]|nr:hypothetical protein G9A89_011202 [Geosiphon pyriformis]